MTPRQVGPPRVGDQLEFELAGLGRMWREPWSGRSPRGLTKVAQKFSLRALPAGGLLQDAASLHGGDQEELVPEGQLLFPFAFDGRIRYG